MFETMEHKTAWSSVLSQWERGGGSEGEGAPDSRAGGRVQGPRSAAWEQERGWDSVLQARGGAEETGDAASRGPGAEPPGPAGELGARGRGRGRKNVDPEVFGWGEQW